jgi:putative glutamine amidotransferase
MTKPVVGIIGNTHLLHDRFDIQMTGQNNFQAVHEVCDALPMMFAGSPDFTDLNALFDTVDGILLTGARANVHPENYDTAAHESYEPYDRERDASALEIVRACVNRSMPLLGICRGFQEMNVAFGGTLHPEIRDVPGRMNHRMPRLENGDIHPDLDVIFAERHSVEFVSGGVFEQLYGRSTIRVNTLHGQAVLEAGERVVVEGVAEDSTVEAIRIDHAPGFALGVQWHAEHDCANNPVNRVIFEAFGEAIREHQSRR